MSIERLGGRFAERRGAVWMAALVVCLGSGVLAQSPGSTPKPGSKPSSVPKAAPGKKEPAKDKKPAFAAPPSTPPTTAQPLKPVDFDAESRATFEDAGLSMPLPQGSLAQRVMAGGESVLEIVPEDQSWRVTVRVAQVSRGDMTIGEYADKAIDAIFEANGVVNVKKNRREEIREKPGVIAVAAELMERVPAAGQREARIDNAGKPVAYERFYMREAQGPQSPSVVRGLTVFSLGTREVTEDSKAKKVAAFCTVQLVAAEPQFAGARPIYEAMIAGATFSTQEVSLQRGAAVQAGRILFQSLDAKTFESLLLSNAERWFRLYRPAPTKRDEDATEIGYMRVQAKLGQRGMLDPTKSPKGWSTIDKQEGYIVQINARFLQEEWVFDSEAIYFMTKDREEEAWAVRTSRRDKTAKDKRQVATAGEIGVRKGGQVSVQVREDGKGEETVRPMIQNDAYISQVDNLLLPQILVHHRANAEYGFYAWQSAQRRIRLRRDTVSQPEGQPGVFRIATRIGDADKEQLSWYKESGELLRRESPDGSITEPTDLDELVKLWKQKQLPMN